jgi:cytochrome c-type biogenesis protein CcmH/NrfG
LSGHLPEVHVLYAKALQFTGDSDLSAKEFKAELAVDPFDFESNLQLGATARQEQSFDEARKFFNRALETRPGDPGACYQLALIAVDEGKLEQCARHWNRW